MKKNKVTRRDLIKNAGLAGAAVATGGFVAAAPAAAQAPQAPTRWDREADVVVIGAGATGMPAAIVAREAGSSVIVVEANSDIGGHAIVSGAQHAARRRHQRSRRKHGIEDSPDLVFQDLTDWSVVQPNGVAGLSLQRPRDHPRLRRQLRADLRIAASRTASCSSTRRPTAAAAVAHGNSVPRQMHVAVAGLAAGADRQAGRSEQPRDHLDRQRPDAPARGGGAQGRRRDSCSSTA